MCAYNVRANKRVDHDPATGDDRAHNQAQEARMVIFGVTMMGLVFWLAHRFLFQG
jgi:hypothetical protein